jgi:hypothetical protein
VVRYQAAAANAVLSPSADPVELLLSLRPDPAEPLVEVRQDGAALDPMVAGSDVRFDEEGRACVHVGRPRMYELAHNATFEPHELELIFRAGGMALYTFTFSGCIM